MLHDRQTDAAKQLIRDYDDGLYYKMLMETKDYWEKNPETPSEPENPTNPTNSTDTVQPSDPGTDPSVFLPVETVHKAIVSRESDSDLAGSKYGLLQLKGSKVKKKIIKLTWKKVPGASKYILYGNACGKKNKLKKITKTGKTAYTVKKLNGWNGRADEVPRKPGPSG